MRYRTVARCKAQGCKKGITSRCKSGYCRGHRYLTRPKDPKGPDRVKAWAEANPERVRQAIADWAVKNRERRRASNSAYAKRRRAREAKAAIEQLRPTFKANIQRVKQETEHLGYVGRLNVDGR